MILSMAISIGLVLQPDNSIDLRLEADRMRSYYHSRLLTRNVLQMLALQGALLGTGGILYGSMYGVSRLMDHYHQEQGGVLYGVGMAAAMILGFLQVPYYGIGSVVLFGSVLSVREPLYGDGARAVKMINSYASSVGSILSEAESAALPMDSASLRFHLLETENKISELTEEVDSKTHESIKSEFYRDYVHDRVRLLSHLVHEAIRETYVGMESSVAPDLKCFQMMRDLANSHSKFFIPKR